jgi:hypothetical protein
MSDVGRVGGHIPPQKQDQVSEKPAGAQSRTPPHTPQTQTPPPNVPLGEPGPHGQPTGMPAPGVSGQTKIMSDALTGRDPSQAIAAEQMRATGAASATEELLGLNRQPPMAGALAPPPGNQEALSHMTPAVRRAVIRSLLQHQHERIRRLANLVQGEGGGGGNQGERRETGGRQEEQLPEAEASHRERALVELGRAVQMLDLLEELLAMQDYTFSQMGAQNQG